MLPSRGKLPLKGIFRDSLLRKNPDGFTPDIVHMVVNKTTSVFNTEQGNEVVSTIALDNNLTIIGIKDILGGGKIIMSINGNTGLDEIGILDDNYNYTAKIQQNLGFDINFPFPPANLQVEYNFRNDLILAFSDNLNTPKIVNLTNPPNPFVLSQIELFPSFKNPIVSADVIENGGSLLAGTYYATFFYLNNDGTKTAYTEISNPVYITSATGSDFNSYDGAAAGDPTSKAIQFTLTNVDTTWDKIVLSIIYEKEGVYIPVEVKEVNTGATVQVNYTGSEVTTDILLDAILIPPAFYNRIAHLTQLQGTLYGADVSEDEPLNLQKYASLINLKFKSELLSVENLQTSYKVNDQNNKKKGFAHEEVYAFYLIAKLKSGGFTQAVHIPGRPSTTIEGSIVGNENDLNSVLLGQDTSLSVDITVDPNSRYYQTRDTTRDLNTGDFTGTFGLWENQSETYPTTDDYNSSDIGGEDLRGLKVRHHRFPSIAKCKEVYYPTNTHYGIDQLDALSIIIDSFPTIPDDILSRIEGFEILYAKRNYSNSTVIGNDLVLCGAYRNGDSAIAEPSRVVYNSGGNWNNTQTGSHDSNINNEYIMFDGANLRLHSFDLAFNKPAIKPSYLSNQLKLSITDIVNKIVKVDRTESVYSYLLDYADTDYLTSGTLSATLPTFADEKKFSLINFKYIPNNVLDSNINNYRSEAFAYARVNAGKNRINLSTNGMPLDEDGNPLPTLSFEESYLTSIMIYKTDMYESFYSQSLASTGLFFLPDAIPTGPIYGGDIFISKYGFLTYAPRILRDIPNSRLPFNTPVSVQTGVKVVRAFLCESVNNIGFRYEISGNTQSKYYPKEVVEGGSTPVGWYLDTDITIEPNFIGYNKDYSSVNDLNAFIPVNPFQIFQADHPFRIIRSTIQNNLSQQLSWQTFLANDFFELQKDTGFITGLQGINDELLILTQTTIFKTRGNEVLNTSGINAFVGSGDIFQRNPIELRTNDKGIGGSQNRFCQLLTPYGFFFADVNAGKVFLVLPNLELKDITTGLYSYFLDNLKTLGDNPFQGTGLTVAYDSVQERIVFCQIDINPFVWSYTPEKESWTSRALYQPEYLFNDRTGFYSLKGQILYKHNANNKAIFYGTIYPSWVVMVFRELPPKRDPYEPRDIQASSIDAWFFGVNWKTEIYLNGTKHRDLTVNQITIWNSYQSTGIIDIQPFNSIKDFKSNIGYNSRRIKDRWVFNQIRDLVNNSQQPFIEDYTSIGSNINHDKDFRLKKRLIDDFLAIKYLFSNELISNLQPDCFLTDAEVEHNPITR